MHWESGPAVIDAVASCADEYGFATLWAGEHVVMVDRAVSHYPYSDDGVIAVPVQADWLGPMVALSFAASYCCPSTIRWWWPNRPRVWIG